MILPTSVDPVKAILLISLWLVINDPVTPSPVTILITPLGIFASMHIWAKSIAVRDVYSAGFKTTVLPIAIAGAIFQASMSKGKFHGII